MIDLFIKNMMQLFTFKIFTNELKSCELLRDYCDVFINYLDSHSDGTHSMQKIHWWASVI